MPIDPGLAGLIRRAIEARLLDVHQGLPARVVAYDAVTQKCDVEIMLRRVVPSNDGAGAEEALPVLADVPVLFPRGGGAFIKFELVKGDEVTLLVSSLAIDAWQASGEVSTAGDRRLHGLSGARVLPCGYPDTKALDEPAGGKVVVGLEGDVQTHWGAGLLRLTGTTDVDFVALATKVDAMFAALYAAVAGTVIVPGDGGAALKAAIGVAGGAYLTTAAAKVKAT